MLHKSVHFIGIGGISMSALAHILLARGIQISGSDRTETDITARLRDDGANITIGHLAENIKNPDLVVYTAAISKDNPELISAQEKGIETLERADFLGELMLDYKIPIAVSGTHGKTTTTSMLSCVLLSAGLSPTILVGGELAQIKGNYHIGTGEHLVFEACEYVDSFLKFNPFAAIVLNVEADHLDYFSGIDQIKSSFNKFISKVPQNGFIVLNSDDENVMECAKGVDRKKVTYGIKNSNANYSAKNITFADNGCASFEVTSGGEILGRVRLFVTGMHNVSNALAVFATAYNLGVEIKDIISGISEFTGTRRRFEKKGEVNGAKVYDDYAHHPTEITATLNAAQNIPHNKIWCIFQPHTYTRTMALLDDFAVSLKAADKVIIADIYAAREPNNGKVHSKDLVAKIEGAMYMNDFKEIAEYVRENIEKDDIVLTMGAGNINEIAGMLV